MCDKRHGCVLFEIEAELRLPWLTGDAQDEDHFARVPVPCKPGRKESRAPYGGPDMRGFTGFTCLGSASNGIHSQNHMYLGSHSVTQPTQAKDTV